MNLMSLLKNESNDEDEITNNVSATIHAEAPDVPGDPFEIHLGRPGPALKQVRQLFADELKELCADLVEQEKSLRDEIAQERKVFEEGNQSVEEFIAQGLDKHQMLEKRTAAGLSQEIIETLHKNLAEVQDDLARVKRQHTSKTSRLNTMILDAEVETRRWMMNYAKGATFNRRSREPAERAFMRLEYMQRELKKHLPAELATAVFDEVTVYKIPATQQDALWSIMSQRAREKHAESPLFDNNH